MSAMRCSPNLPNGVNRWVLQHICSVQVEENASNHDHLFAMRLPAFVHFLQVHLQRNGWKWEIRESNRMHRAMMDGWMDHLPIYRWYPRRTFWYSVWRVFPSVPSVWCTTASPFYGCTYSRPPGTALPMNIQWIWTFVWRQRPSAVCPMFFPDNFRAMLVSLWKSKKKKQIHSWNVRKS